MQKKYPAKTDVAVLLVFFTRSSTFRQVFDEVRKARPTRLLLFQDGPRNEQDEAGIAECRQIASDEEIDWECDVQRNFQQHNLGCLTGGLTAHRWAFSLAEKVIVLEDDVVPSQSFFTFCKEMLDRYEDDERITMVSGFNIDEQTADCPDSYFFTSAFSIWGWASWRRVVGKWDEQQQFLDSPYLVGQLQQLIKARGYKNDFISQCNASRSRGVKNFETVFWAHMMLNNGLAIMPAKNMINNIGATSDSAHYAALNTLPHDVRRIFTMQRYELAPPIRHPQYVVDNVGYMQRMYRCNGWGYPWLKVKRSVEELLLNLRYGNFARIGSSLLRRIRKMTGGDRQL